MSTKNRTLKIGKGGRDGGTDYTRKMSPEGYPAINKRKKLTDYHRFIFADSTFCIGK